MRKLFAGGPGDLFVIEVGEGEYEEVNAVTSPGMNFGWPCWQGPLPHARYRDSPFDGADWFTGRAPDGSILSLFLFFSLIYSLLSFVVVSLVGRNEIVLQMVV
jgi:hypothetical protein